MNLETNLDTSLELWDHQDFSQVQMIRSLGSKSGQIKDCYMPQSEGLIKGKVDAILIETSQDILELKMAIEACHEAMDNLSVEVP